jgi:hypothetical protein
MGHPPTWAASAAAKGRAHVGRSELARVDPSFDRVSGDVQPVSDLLDREPSVTAGCMARLVRDTLDGHARRPSGQRGHHQWHQGRLQAGTIVSAKARFAGARFGRCQQVGEFDPAFTGGAFKAETAVPAWVFKQIEARKRAWPVDYSEAERQAAYLNSDRLLLFINIAEPDDEKMKVSLHVDGQSVPMKPAYTSVVRSNPRNTFVGWYADLTALTPEVKHTITVELPTLKPGQFQGLFFENVEAAFTSEITAAN